MTRMARGIVVFAFLTLAFAWEFARAGDPVPPTPPAPAQEPAEENPAAPPPAAGPTLPRAMLRNFTVEGDKIEPTVAETLSNSFTSYNFARDTAEDTAKKAGKSQEQQAEAVRKDPAVVSALGAVRDVVKGKDLPPQVVNQVAEALNVAEQHKDSLALSEQVIARDRDNRDALNNIAQSRFSLGQYRQAIEDATRVTQKDPNNETAYTTRALSRYYSGEYVAAAEDARRALALNKNNDIAVATLSMAVRAIQPASLKLTGIAAAQAAQIKAEHQSLLEQRNQVEAESARAVPGPNDATSRTAAKIVSDDQLGAIAEADKAINANPADAQAWYLRAAARNMAGEHAQAAVDATEALRLAPGHALALDVRAKANFALGHWKETVEDATQSIRLDPSNAYAFATRARAFEKLGEFASMLSDFQQAARQNRQFEPEYERAAARRALPPAPEAKPVMAPEAPTRRLWLVTVSSVVGGTLIAIGLLHIFSTQWNRKLTTALKRLEDARAAVTPPVGDLGKLSSHFQIVRAIGRGGMGVVYEALDKGLNRRVALKKMRDEIRIDPRERERFLQEARTVGSLHHPNIVDIHAIYEEGGELCLVFEHVSGRTVEQLLEAKKRLSLPDARHILRGVCQALEYAHKRGVIHRDLKPSNIMLTDDNEVKVMDFGIARHAKDALSRMTVTNTVAGTPPYMPPEADQGVIRPESDVYGLGACLYEMLTGERPFPNHATTSAKLAMSYPKPTRLRGDLPHAVDALIDAALQPDPDKRIPTAAKFLSQLEAAFSVPA